MRILSQYIAGGLNQFSVDEMSNGLLLDLYGFGDIACLNGGVMGVFSGNDRCESARINACARRYVMRSLFSSHKITEEQLGYPITRSYHRAEILWDGRRRVQLPHGSIEKFNFERAFTVPTTGPTNAIVPNAVLAGASSVDSGNGYCRLPLPTSRFSDPSEVVIRKPDGTIVRQQSLSGMPEIVGSDWRIALDKPAPPSCETNLSVQDVKSAHVAVPENSVLVYPGSRQIVPELGRYFHDGQWYAKVPWEVLLKNDFIEDGADLFGKREFYKIIPSLDIRNVSEVAADPIAIVREYSLNGQTSWVEKEDILTIRMVNAQRGIIEVEVKAGCCYTCTPTTPIKLVVYYITNPEVIDAGYSLGSIREAIAYRIAAGFPVTSCKCPPQNEGFIADAMKPYTDIRINPVTGENIANVRFGNTFGNLVFAETIKHAVKNNRASALL